ncbi:MAG: nicotinate (nicotinamide) nucleotide adenylyltransferase [Clostridia bacterium]|nr:nicotinate (nicotinamide) nucleotide adenylyltransferase [Clostridia bacterium]
MGNIAVFGGTFNPFHIGHYEILKTLCESDLFYKVLLIPDRIPPHKKVTYTVSDEDRIEMCRIAAKDFEKAEICLIEFEREGKSYTVDTVKELRSTYPDDKFYITVGADMVKTLDTWYNFKELKKIASFAAFNRGGDKEFKKDVERMRTLGVDILVFENEITKVSSSELRVNLKPELLPEKVYEYANKRRIYKQ